MLRSIRRQVNVRSASGRAALALVALGLLAAPSAAHAQEPAADTHTVRSGDTLWDLAARYLKDPFLWPEIYRLNTSVVEDPHWIYPGEVLVLVAREPVAAVPATDTPAPDPVAQPAAAAGDSAAARPAVYEEPADDRYAGATLAISGRGRADDSLRLAGAATAPVHVVPAGDFRGAAFLAEDRLDTAGEVLGPVMPRQIGASGATRQTLMLGTDIVIKPPRGGTYQVGDSVAIYRYDRKEIHPFGAVVLPTGIAVVREQATTERYVARVVRMFGEITRGQLLLPLEPFTPVEVGAVQPEQGLTGEVVGWPGFERLKGLGDQLFIDRGEQDGVRIGDLFELRRAIDDEREVLVPITIATARVVHVGERSATLKVVHVTGPDIRVGTEALQVGRVR